MCLINYSRQTGDGQICSSGQHCVLMHFNSKCADVVHIWMLFLSTATADLWYSFFRKKRKLHNTHTWNLCERNNIIQRKCKLDSEVYLSIRSNSAGAFATISIHLLNIKDKNKTTNWHIAAAGVVWSTVNTVIMYSFNNGASMKGIGTTTVLWCHLWLLLLILCIEKLYLLKFKKTSMMLMPTLSIQMFQCGDKGKICNMIAEMTTSVNEQPTVCRCSCLNRHRAARSRSQEACNYAWRHSRHTLSLTLRQF